MKNLGLFLIMMSMGMAAPASEATNRVVEEEVRCETRTKLKGNRIGRVPGFRSYCVDKARELLNQQCESWKKDRRGVSIGRVPNYKVRCSD